MTLTESCPVSGGCINNSSLVVFEDSTVYFLKWNAQAPVGFFTAEAEGLSALKGAGVFHIPKVICTEDDPDSAPLFLLMEMLTPGEKTPAREAELGRKLAVLHRVEEERFGFEQDNFIGHLVQKNSWESSWSEFFFTHRLCAQAALGQESGWFQRNFEELLRDKEQQIRDTLDNEPQVPSLLHGDLWAGNVFWSSDGPVLIDPAVYYGSREADIAFTELFSRFGGDFYRAYDEDYPLSPGYAERRPILNLYHQMTHANMFGGGYIQDVYRTLKALPG